MSSKYNTPRPISISQPLIKSNYSPKLKVSISFQQNSPFTKQSFKDECDINLLMARYMRTGELPNINERAPEYLDTTTGYDFQAAMQLVAEANSLFQDLPSRIRNRFQNDPAAFLDFCSDENNRPELAAMGLLKDISPSPIPTPQPSPENAPQALSDDL
ncbi:MAG: internal scaffolding protein [Microviridae sp.]|nr:MAG: internal scaffolding protein [Microviridae sp.]